MTEEDAFCTGPTEYLSEYREKRDFEGVIPDGEHSAGDVIVWEGGAWSSDEPGFDVRTAVDEGEVHVDLTGEKLAGRLAPIRRDGSRTKDVPCTSTTSSRSADGVRTVTLTRFLVAEPMTRSATSPSVTQAFELRNRSVDDTQASTADNR